MEGFITFIVIVFGVLQLILFFKIWGMTNDVDKLKSKFCKSKESEISFEEMLVRINYQKGKGEALKMLENKLEKDFANLIDAKYIVQYFNEQHNKLLKEYKFLYGYLGCEVPEWFANFDYDRYQKDVYALENGRQDEDEKDEDNDYFVKTTN